jgi:ABC-type phosphate transport system substrate-binding protein
MSSAVPPPEPLRVRRDIVWTTRRAALGALLVGLWLSSAGELSAAEQGFVVIVRRDEQGPVLDRAFVAEAFLKKRTRWPNGEVIRPVDQRRDSNVRHQFSQNVLKRSVEAVRNYWQQRIFSGRDVPPPEVDSDAAVIHYVRENPGAIGYVTTAVDGDGIRVVTLR